jgi:transposase
MLITGAIDAMTVTAADGAVVITSAQLGYMHEGIDRRLPQRTWRPQATG